jgi:hypothetical protein
MLYSLVGRLSIILSVLAIAGAAAMGCGSSSSPSATPTPVPSKEADDLFQQALKAMAGTTSLRFETQVYEGDALVLTRLDEQEAPNRARRVDKDLKTGDETENIIVGLDAGQRTNGGKLHTITLENQPPFAYPDLWFEEYGSLTGFAIVGEETIEGKAAVVIRDWHQDPEGGADAYNEELVSIDRETGRILKWDVNKFQMEGGKPKLVQQWKSSIWQFDVPVDIELS